MLFGKKLSLCGRPLGDKKKIGSFKNCLKIRAPKRGAKPRARQEIHLVLSGWDYWTKSELILRRILMLNSKNLYARAGKKEGVWGEGIFARPRFSVAAEFRISLCEMRRQRRCCPCPSPPVRGQRQETP